MQRLYDKWLFFAPLGLILIGLGTSVTQDAATRKAAGRSWFWRGTLGLCVLNAGIAIFGDAVKDRALYEWRMQNRA